MNQSLEHCLYQVSVCQYEIQGAQVVLSVHVAPSTDPPNITAPPSELSPSNITTCCAGVRLNLADPDDVSDVSVLLNTSSDGSYEMVSAGNLTHSGDILYIMGLQAGNVYSANITVSNIFGTTTQQTTLKPVLGMPKTSSTGVNIYKCIISLFVSSSLQADPPTQLGPQ